MTKPTVTITYAPNDAETFLKIGKPRVSDTFKVTADPRKIGNDLFAVHAFRTGGWVLVIDNLNAESIEAAAMIAWSILYTD